MRSCSLLVLGSWVVLVLMVAGNTFRRASQPSPVNGPVRILSEAAR
ncbi:hypothetical protein [Methylobacterium terrae]|nr:hypothetical protein [Methylobacterium terrae]